MRRVLSCLLLCGVLSSVACGNEKVKVLKSVLATPSLVDFGSHYIGTRTELPLTLSNSGPAAITVGSTKIEGDTRLAFSFTNAPAVLAGGATVTVTVVYNAPSTVGSDEAQLVFSGGDASDQLRIALKGQSTATCPTGTVESSCGDGQDNDCDGKTDCDDSDCATTAACRSIACGPTTELRVTNDAETSGAPMLRWNGTDFATVWMGYMGSSGMSYSFARVSDSNTVVTAAKKVTTSPTVAHAPTFVWTGSEYGLGWSDVRASRNDMFFMRLNASGDEIGADVPVTAGPSGAFPGSIAWNDRDHEYGLIWSQQYGTDPNQKNVTLQRAAADGHLLGTAQRASSATGGSDYVFAVWSGTGYGAAWVQFRNGGVSTSFQRLNADGTAVGTELSLSTAGVTGYNVALTWTGTEYGVVWNEVQGTTTRVFFARVSADGQLVGTTHDLVAGVRPTIAWSGKNYAIAYSDKRDATDQIYLAKLSSDGTMVGLDQKVSCGTAVANSPNLSWNGSAFGLAWSDQRDGNGEIYFRTLPASLQ